MPALPVQYSPAEEQRDAAELVVKWVLAVCCLFAVIGAISAAAGWLSVRL